MAIDLPLTDLLDRVRSICLELPQASEKETWGQPTFRVRDKIFVGASITGEGIEFAPESIRPADSQPAILSLSMKSTPADQAGFLARGEPFFRPRYVGNNGWIGIVIDQQTDWDEVEETIMDSYCHVAPKRLARLLIVDEP